MGCCYPLSVCETSASQRSLNELEEPICEYSKRPPWWRRVRILASEGALHFTSDVILVENVTGARKIANGVMRCALPTASREHSCQCEMTYVMASSNFTGGYTHMSNDGAVELRIWGGPALIASTCRTWVDHSELNSTSWQKFSDQTV